MPKEKTRIAIITGASSGFGRLFAQELEKSLDLEEIWLVARREDKLIETAGLLKRAKGVVLAADLSTPEGIEAVCKKAEAEDPNVRVLINNAGFGRSEEFAKGDEKYYIDMIDVNIKAPVMLTKKLLKFMKEGSKIMNLSSSAAFAPLPYFTVYAASKSFILNFSYALNEELKPKGISVMAVCPGPAQTEFFKTKEKKMNGLTIEDPKKIVEKALSDMKKGKQLSVYGSQMNFLRIVSKFIPRKYLANIAGKVKFPK